MPCRDFKAQAGSSSFRSVGVQAVARLPAAAQGMLSSIPFGIIRSATGDFDARARLGEGGFGRVYGGRVDNRRLAFKVFGAEDVVASMRYAQRELAVMSFVRHPCIVSFVGFAFEPPNPPVLVYERLKGCAHISFGPDPPHAVLHDPFSDFTWSEFKQAALDVAAALHHLHRGVQGMVVVHWDVKPDNIFLSSLKRAKLGDFGLALYHAREADTVPMNSRAFRGTRGYYQHGSGYTVPRTAVDVYAYGVTFSQLLLRERVVSAVKRVILKDPCEILVAVRAARPSWALPPSVPDEQCDLLRFVSLCQKCLTCEAPRRPTMKDVVDQLSL